MILRRVLLLVWGGQSFGRAVVAVELGRALRRTNIEVHAVSGLSDAGLFTSVGMSHESWPAVPAPLLSMFLQDLLERVAPSAIVLCDGQSCLDAFLQAGVDLVAIAAGIPVAGVDTYDSVVTGGIVDIFGTIEHSLTPWPPGIRRLIPAPLASPTQRVGGFRAHTHRGTRQRHTRKGTSRVLMASATWQHAELNDPLAVAVQKIVPRRVGYALANLRRTELLHVGPSRFDVGDRVPYTWLGTLASEIFESTLASADVLLTLTPVGSTVHRALSAGIPVIWLRNAKWLRLDDAVEVYPFSVWPLGYQRFLEPLLAGNPFIDAITSLDLSELDTLPEVVAELCTREESSTAAGRQAQYLDLIERMPPIDEALRAATENPVITLTEMGR